MSEVEPRRSVRATKGQHTKAFDEQLESAPAPAKKRQTKKSKKAQEQEQEAAQEEDEQDEIIRCVCGATEQDEDSGEAWISCETCYAWQHNVCVGVSSYEDEIPENYWCEQCRPELHKELLEGMAKGEKPWEERRKAHEEKKRRKGGRKPKGGRKSDPPKEDAEKDGAKGKVAKPSPAPEPPKEKEKKETTTGRSKRKTREESQDTDSKSSKVRRVSTEPTPPRPKYTPPKDLEPSIKELPPTRNGPAKALKKSLVHVMTIMSKNEELEVPEGSTVDSMAETSALQIERAVFDTHPMAKGQKEYSQQIKSLTHNLKNNLELVHGLIQGVHTPPTLAVMTSDQLASAERQKQTAEMKAKAEKASILYQGETSGPRVRRTHKGEEVVEDESFVNRNEDAPLPLPPGGGGGASGRRAAGKDKPANLVKRESTGADQAPMPARSPSQDDNRSPSQTNFDINKVFSSVRSPTTSHARRPSAHTPQQAAAVEDADVDRLLQEDNDSPPYSPTEEAQDPDVVWRGSLAMSSIADFQAVAKHVGGANFASIGPWSKLIPRRLTVAGRIPQQSAIEYLCGLRYSSLTDVVVVNIEPVSPDARAELTTMINYFISKKRYGVVGDKVAGNVRDTYLVPVPAGEDNHPEFMLNLVDNHIPKTRTDPMLLAVFVYRNDPAQLKTSATPPTPSQPDGTPTPASATQAHFAQRSNSTSGPAFSPATPSATGGGPPNGPLHSTTPVPIPQPPSYRAQAGGQQSPPPAGQAQSQAQQQPPAQAAQQPQQQSEQDAQRVRALQEGQAMAHEVLGPELMSSATVQFLLPQAWQMSRREWEVIRKIYQKEPRARDDLPFLGKLLESEGKASAAAANNNNNAAGAGGASASS